MQRIFIVLFCATGLLFGTSCAERLDIESSNGSEDVSTTDPKIEKLIQRARHGEVAAYEALAVCYRDGDGVRQSLCNRMMMSAFSCNRSGKDIEDFAYSLDENDPFRLLVEVLDYVRVEDVSQEAVDRLRRVSPADAMIYDALYALEYRKDTLSSQLLLNEAVAKGSDVACVIQIIFYEELGCQEQYERSLHEYADRVPILYVELGELSLQSDSDGHLEQAVKYYTLADSYGMLSARGALGLSTAYRMLEEEGKMKCDPQEMKRLEVLAQRL